MTVTILHRGWRANDTLLDNGKGQYLLTYYTYNKRKGVASEHIGLLLYKNQRVFSDEDKAQLFYMIDTSKRTRR